MDRGLVIKKVSSSQTRVREVSGEVNRGVYVLCTEKQKSSLKLVIIGFQLMLFAATANAGPKGSPTNECWKSPDGKEICDQPKPAPPAPNDSQFTFKVGSPDSLKEHYEENHGPEHTYFPQAALKAARDNEIKELKRVESAEKASIEDRDNLENKKQEAMQEIQKHKFEMAELKRKQENLSNEMELMNNELVNIKSQETDLGVQSVELDKKVNVVSDKHQESTQSLRASQQKLQAKAQELTKKRLETEAKVSKMQIEMQQAVNQIAKDQTLIARAESDRIQYEAQEIHVASQLTALTERKKEIAIERERATDEISQLKKRLNAVKDDYNIAKLENDSLEKEVKILTARLNKDRVDTNTEIQGLERKILAAKDAKFRNDNEKTRLVAEADRMKVQLIDVQKRYEKVAAEETASSLAVMESRVELETSKTEVSTTEAAIEDLKAHGKTERDQIRNIASLAASSEMLETQQKAKVVKACKIFGKPENSNEFNGRLKKGSIVVTAPSTHGFYKVLNSSGSAQYVYQTCLEVVE